MSEHAPGECEDADCWAHSDMNEDDEDEQTPVYDKAGLHVMAEPCSTCIFKPGNLMRLDKGRVKDMTDSTDREDTNVVCHQTLGQPVGALCHGSVERRPGQMVRIGERLNAIVKVQP